MSPSIVYVSREAPVAAVRRLACLEGGAQSRVTSDCDLTCGAEKVLVMNALEALAGASTVPLAPCTPPRASSAVKVPHAGLGPVPPTVMASALQPPLLKAHPVTEQEETSV